jgi:hypothetical protein
MVALGEDCDAVDVSALEGSGEFLGVEIGADPGDVLRSVEVEVDLALMSHERVLGGRGHGRLRGVRRKISV